jgi:hypothetical protein
LRKEKKIAREIKKEKLPKSSSEIDKEEEVERKHKFLFDDQIDVSTKIKCKRRTGDIVFNDVVDTINLTEEDKKFLESSSSTIRRSFWRSSQIMIS